MNFIIKGLASDFDFIRKIQVCLVKSQDQNEHEHKEHFVELFLMHFVKGGQAYDAKD